MPRHHAPLLTSIWNNEDFQQLSPLAQRMYMQILSQKRLSLVGVLPYQPRNLARGCAALTVEDVERDVAELVDNGYVIIDADTQELMVRTILKHDPPRGSRTIAGMWNAWREVDSEMIRERLIHSMDDRIWDESRVDPPEAAKALRNAPYEGASKGHPQIENQLSAATGHLPPSTGHLPLESSREISTSTDGESRTKKIIDLIVTERCKNARPTNMTSYRAKVTEDVTATLGARIDELAGMFPTAPDRTIATAAETGETRPLAYFTEESA